MEQTIGSCSSKAKPWDRDFKQFKTNTNLKTLKMVYYSLLASYLQYGAQLWGQANKESQKEIQAIQNRALRKISFKKLHDFTAQLYKGLKLLKFCDICKTASS